MCRNITELRGLEPAATPDEVLAGARQYVRRVSGMREPNDRGRDAFERAVAEAAASATRLLGALPARRRPPTTPADQPASTGATPMDPRVSVPSRW